ncbi:MAG: SDR family oxidoreductase [Acidimicrobiales bacterium]|nr:SDR family oxidoreductase [Acidimicrobiales bacterium]
MDLNELFSVQGKTAIVTGGSRGIGYMIATGLLSAGARVYITARKAAACDAAAEELSELGECVSLPADLSTSEGMSSFVAAFNQTEDKLHILCNNAGANWVAPLGDVPEEGFDKVIDINLKSPFFLTQALLPNLKAAATPQDPARVIMTGSINGIAVPWVDNFSYSASKAGLHMIARHMGQRLAKDHITVNSIAPGPFESKMMAAALEGDGKAMVEGMIPLGRIGSPEDMAGTVLWLCSRAGAYITGTVIPIDGGVTGFAS